MYSSSIEYGSPNHHRGAPRYGAARYRHSAHQLSPSETHSVLTWKVRKSREPAQNLLPPAPHSRPISEEIIQCIGILARFGALYSCKGSSVQQKAAGGVAESEISADETVHRITLYFCLFSLDADPRRQSVEYRWRWVFWRWPCIFHVYFMLFVHHFPRRLREN